jgi:hypothetical protein
MAALLYSFALYNLSACIPGKEKKRHLQYAAVHTRNRQNLCVGPGLLRSALQRKVKKAGRASFSWEPHSLPPPPLAFTGSPCCLCLFFDLCPPKICSACGWLLAAPPRHCCRRSPRRPPETASQNLIRTRPRHLPARQVIGFFLSWN